MADSVGKRCSSLTTMARPLGGPRRSRPARTSVVRPGALSGVSERPTVRKRRMRRTHDLSRRSFSERIKGVFMVLSAPLRGLFNRFSLDAIDTDDVAVGIKLLADFQKAGHTRHGVIGGRFSIRPRYLDDLGDLRGIRIAASEWPPG